MKEATNNLSELCIAGGIFGCCCKKCYEKMMKWADKWLKKIEENE